MTTREMTLEERLDFIEFRQQLLFENTDFTRLVFEYNLTREQLDAVYDVFDNYRSRIDNGESESVHHGAFEQAIYSAVPEHDGNYHFAEGIAQVLHEERRYQEVFETLYGDMPKFQSYMNNRG